MSPGRSMIRQSRRSLAVAVISVLGALYAMTVWSGPTPNRDPHYARTGFFDIHVCNWPDRSSFLMVLYSTPRFAEIERIEVFRPDGRALTTLDLQRYRVIQKKGKPEKRVFMMQLAVPPDATDGWYVARVTLRGGRQETARDFVVLFDMPRPGGMFPGPDATDIAIPAALTWNPVSGASHYKVFIRDVWDDGRLIYESGMLTKPLLALPKGLIKPGGVYAWRVHARDVNENILLGDFNHGSLSQEIQFTTAP